jgi:hypothetical protein
MCEYNETVHQLFVDFKEAYGLVGKEVLCCILIEFGPPMEIVRLIKMCLNESCSKVGMRKHVLYVRYSKRSESSRCFIAILYKLPFRFCH